MKVSLKKILFITLVFVFTNEGERFIIETENVENKNHLNEKIVCLINNYSGL